MRRAHRNLIGATTVVAVASGLLAGSTSPAPPPLTVASGAHAINDQWREPVSTATLIAKAQPELVTASAGASTPPGTPGAATLSRHVTPACIGDGSDGNRVQVLYARDSDKASRFTAVLPVLRTQVASVDDLFAASAAKYGGGARVRWVTGPDCDPLITEVVLPKGTLSSGNWTTFRSAMAAKGFTSNERKYLVFGDANAICGLGDTYLDDNPDPDRNYNNGRAPMYARVDSGCWLPGTSQSGNAPAHEVMHTLGAVSHKAPHASAHGHCTDTLDTMCYKDAPTVTLHQVCTQERLFDCHGDDYFNPKPTPGSWLAEHWNTANSSFLAPAVPLPPAPAGSTATAPSTVLTGARFTMTAKAPAGAVSYTWSGPGITGGAKTTKATAQVNTPSVATYRVRIEFSNGGAVTLSKTVTVRKAPKPALKTVAPAKARTKAKFTVSMAPKVTGAVKAYRWGVPSICKAARPTSRYTTVTCTLPRRSFSATVRLTALVAQADGQSAAVVTRSVRITR